MSALTTTTKQVKDGGGNLVTTELYADPNNGGAVGPLSAILLSDGTVLGPGQQLAAASLPVVLTAAQLTTLTPPTTVAIGTKVEKFLLGSQSTLLSTELNSLANNGTALGSVFNNTVGQTGDGYTLCDVELVVTYGSAPTANTGVSLWFLGTQDNSNFEDGDNSTTPGRAPDVVFPLRAVTTAQRIIRRVWLPWGQWKPCCKNDSVGQAMTASGNTVKIRPTSRESV